MSLEQIGREIGLTRERVRQIETQALERLAREREVAAMAPA
jgi:DNA-directed RNA polymerase sigma subunit (sigma70/sigma32)